MLILLPIVIFGGAKTGPADGCLSRSYSWIDGFEIAETMTTSTTDNQGFTREDILIFPNPSNGTIRINTKDMQSYRFEIVDLLGRIVKSGVLENSVISTELEGIFILRLFRENKIVVTRKLVFN